MAFQNLTGRAEIAALAVRAQQSGAGHILPLMRAALAGELRLIIAPPGHPIPNRQLDPKHDRRPCVAVLGDDTTLNDPGPAGFPQAQRLLRWARFIVLHAAGGQAAHYARARDAAHVVGRVLIVETAGARLGAWDGLRLAAAPLTPVLIVRVPPGLPAHPHIAPASGEAVH